MVVSFIFLLVIFDPYENKFNVRRGDPVERKTRDSRGRQAAINIRRLRVAEKGHHLRSQIAGLSGNGSPRLTA